VYIYMYIYIYIYIYTYSSNRTMLIFSADSPVLKMGDEEGKKCSNVPLKLAYHRHFYALGEHYNSVAPVVKPCSCSIDAHTDL
jgi:hypothetical protein